MANYYEVLGIEQNCSQNEIKTSFRKRAKEIHPDIQGLHSNSHDKMRQLIKAYETLSDPEKRFEYDKRLKFNNDEFNYRDFLYRKKSDPAIKCRLIFYDLKDVTRYQKGMLGPYLENLTLFFSQYLFIGHLEHQGETG